MVSAELAPIVDSGPGYEVRVDCPSDGSMWRDIKVLYEYTNFTLINRPGLENGGISIKSEIDVLVRCRYTISIGALGVSRTVCSNSLALLRYKGPIEVDIEMSFVAATAEFVVTPDVRVWTDWNSLEPTCLQGTIDKVYTTLKAFRVDLKREAEKKLTNGLEKAIVDHLIFPSAHEPYTNMFLEYRVNSMLFDRDESIVLSAVGNVSALLGDGTRVYHAFGGAESGDPLPEPPNDWASELLDQTKTPMLFGLRLSTDLFTAVGNATRMILRAYDGNTTVANSSISYNITVAEPVFTVNRNGQLSAVFASGSADAKCETEPNANRAMIDLNFAHLNASVRVHYVGRDEAYADAVKRIKKLVDKGELAAVRDPMNDEVHVGLVVRFENLTFDAARIELKAPPVPFDTRVLNNVVQAVIESQRDTINDVLAQYPLALSRDLQQYFPHPRVRAIELRDSRGFVESATRCVCGAAIPDAGFESAIAACTFTCGRVDLTLAPATAAPLTSTVAAAATTTTVAATRKRLNDDNERRIARQLGVNYDGDGVTSSDAHHWKRQVNATGRTFVMLAYNNENCRLDQLGFSAQILQLPETGGQCVELPTLLGAFTAVRGTFYSLTTKTRLNAAGEMESAVSLDFGCVAGCEGDCTVINPSLSTAKGTCNNAGTVSRESFVMQEWTSTACIGGNLWFGDSEDPVVAMLQGWKQGGAAADLCPPYNAPRTDRNNLAAADFIFSFGLRRLHPNLELDSCANINPRSSAGGDASNYAKVLFDSSGVASYSVGCRRAAGSGSAGMNATVCENCSRMFGAVPYGTCLAPSNTVEAGGGVTLGVPFFKPMVLTSCNFDDPSRVAPATTTTSRTNGTLFVPSPPAEEDEVSPLVLGLSIGIPVGVCLLIVLLTLCFVCGWASHLRAFYSNHTWSFGAPPPGKRYLFIFLTFGAFISVIQAAIWTVSETISEVDEGFFSARLGVDDRFVHPGVFSSRLRLWRDVGAVILCFNAFLAIALLIDGVLVRSRKDEAVEGNPMYNANTNVDPAELAAEREAREARKLRRKVGLRVRRYIWFTMLVLQTVVFLVVPLFVAYEMLGTITVTPQDSKIVASIRDVLESLLNASGAVYVFNIIMEFFVNTWQLLPAGAMFGTVIFLADMGSSVGSGATLISRGLWVTAAAINVTLHFVAPIALCPAVLISLHRYNVERAWWLALVWLVLWCAGVVFVYLAMFKNAELAENPGQLLVKPHRYMFAYMFVTIACTFLLVIGDFLYTSDSALFAFFLFFRLTMFFFTGCYVRVWLEAYRPKWSTEIIHAAQEHEEKANLEREATVRSAKIAENTNRRERARNAAFLHFEVEEDAQQMLKNETSWDKCLAKLSACCGCCVKYTLVPLAAPIAAMSYWIEYGRPATNSLPRRRTWLVLGAFFGLIMAIEGVVYAASFDSKQDTVDFVNNADERLLFGFRWPEGEAGDIFDEGFELHTTLTKVKVAFVFLCIVAVVGMLIDDWRTAAISQEACQRSVERQTFAGIAIIMVLFVVALAPSTPDYPRVASFGDSLPQCGEEFNEVVRKFYGGAVGLVLTAVTTKGLIAILLVMLASAMRGTRMIIAAALHALHPHHDDDHHEHTGCMKYMKWVPPLGPSPPAVIDHAMVIYQLSAIVNPLVVGIPMLFFYLFDSGPVLLILYLVNWFLTAIVAVALSPKFIDINYFASVWGVFFASLLAIILIKLDQYDLLDPAKIVVALQSWSTYSTIIFTLTEICIANVIVSDIVYYIIWALYPDYSVVAAVHPHHAHGEGTKLDKLDTDFAAGNKPALRTMHSAHTLRQLPVQSSTASTMRQQSPSPSLSIAPTMRQQNTNSGMFSTDATTAEFARPAAAAGGASTMALPLGVPGGQGGDFACNVCGNRYATPADVDLHMAKRHNGPMP
jgi:hypothetical protein